MMSQSIGTGRAFARDEKGGIAIIAAVCLSLMLGMSALAVDSAVFYLQKRKLQSATDLAAIAAASAPGNAQAAANATLARNGFATPAVVLVEYGTYTSDAATPTANRFVAQASGGNAIRLTTQINSPVYFSRVFSITRAAASGVTQLETVPANTVQINAKAIAMQTNTAAFSVGSRLLGLNGGLANAVLGSLLGTNVSLSLMDYQSLASANIDMFAFSRALATRLSLTGVSYDQLAATSVRSGTVVSAMADAVANNPVAVLALRSIATSIGNTGAIITIAPLVSFGPYGNLAVSTSTPVTAIANAMDMASAVAQISNGTRQVLVNLGASVPGLAAATLQLSIGARPVDSSLVAIGAQGSTLHTAQTRLLINASVGSAALGTAVSVPLYLELASANASLSTISCPNLDPTAASVGLSVTPAVLNASIGAVSASDFTNFTRSASVTPATLVSVLGGIASVTGQAYAAMTNVSPTLVPYSAADIAAVTRKTTSTTDYTTSLITSLLGTLQLRVQIVGLGLGLPSNLDTTVAQVLSAASVPLDQVLAGTLTALGIGIGQADTWVSGVKCGAGVLVN